MKTIISEEYKFFLKIKDNAFVCSGKWCKKCIFKLIDNHVVCRMWRLFGVQDERMKDYVLESIKKYKLQEIKKLLK